MNGQFPTVRSFVGDLLPLVPVQHRAVATGINIDTKWSLIQPLHTQKFKVGERLTRRLIIMSIMAPDQ